MAAAVAAAAAAQPKQQPQINESVSPSSQWSRTVLGPASAPPLNKMVRNVCQAGGQHSEISQKWCLTGRLQGFAPSVGEPRLPSTSRLGVSGFDPQEIERRCTNRHFWTRSADLDNTSYNQQAATRHPEAILTLLPEVGGSFRRAFENRFISAFRLSCPSGPIHLRYYGGHSE